MFALFVTSCSNEDFEQEPNSSKVTTASMELRSASGAFKTLGFGYDVTGEYLSLTSVKRPIIDVEKMYAETSFRVYSNTETGGSNYFYYGYSSLDYIKNINDSSGFTASLSGKDFDKLKICGFGSSFTNNSEFQSKYTYSSKYSFASVDITKRVHSFRIDDKVDNYRKYVTKEFLEDLKNYTPDEFVKYYGTHVLTNIEYGGVLKIIYWSSILEESNYERKKSIVKAGLNGFLKGVGLSSETDKTHEIEEKLTTKNQQEKVIIDYKSGDGVGGVYDLTTGKLNGLDKGSWEKSVTLQNAGLTKINWQETYPIYDFIEDPTKKAQIKAAVEKYIASKQIEMLEIVPLYRYYSSGRSHHFYTTNWNEQGNGKNGLAYEWVEAFVSSKQIEGTTPLYRYYNSKRLDHVYTTNWNELGNGKYDYKLEGNEGYIYKTQVPGTVPLYRYYHSKKIKHVYTSVWDELGNGKYGFSFEKIEGYVYPGNNTNY